MQSEPVGVQVADPQVSGQRLGTVTVTYRPNFTLLQRQLQALPVDAIKVIVDNSSDPEVGRGLLTMCQVIPGLRVLYNETNRGLAAALDQGVRELASLASRPTHVLLLDQDSEPLDRAIPTLLDALDQLERQGTRPGAVGPQLLDPDTGLMHGFHRMTRWRWRRSFPPPSEAPLPIANLNGSGTLMRIQTYLEQGGLDTSLFIDHVDTEWSFRLLATGHTLWGVPSAVFRHAMGERGLRIWLLGWRVWPARSPARHRYLFRNSLWLMRRGYVPLVWKFWCAVKILVTLASYGLFSRQRLIHVREMLAGVMDALRHPNARTLD